MIRFGESCLYSMRGRCFNKAAEHHKRPCPHVGEQFCCPWYNGTIPRVSCAGSENKKNVMDTRKG